MSRYYRETVQNSNSRPAGSQRYLLREQWKIYLITGEEGYEKNLRFSISESTRRGQLETMRRET